MAYLCCLLSNAKIMDESDASIVQILDNLNTNFYDIKLDSSLAGNIKKLTSLLVPFYQQNKVNLEILGSNPFYGTKNYEYNCIEQANTTLQSHSTWILDELEVVPGKVGEIGAKNAKFLEGVIAQKRMYYDFKYYIFESLMNSKVISLS